MERNKQIIVAFVFITCLSCLVGYIYMSFFNDSKEEEKTKIEFEVPEILNKKKSNKTKIEYYNSQIESKNISDGILLEKKEPSKDTFKFKVTENSQNIFFEEEKSEKVLMNSYKKDYQNNFTKEKIIEESSDQIQSEESLSKLLDIMESNSEYMNNLGKETSTSYKLKQENKSTRDDIIEIIKSIPEQEKITSDRNIYREVLKEKKYFENAFFGISKNKKAFTGAISDARPLKKELFNAEVYTNQVISNGGLVMIHLLEDLFFEEDIILPKSTVLYGIAEFSPTRMFIKVSPNILKNKKRLPHPIIIYDFDGFEGVFMQINSIGSIPVETARELTELVKESYKSSNPITGNSGVVPLKEAATVIGSEKILKHLNRLKLKIFGGYKIWLSISEDK